VLVSIGLVIAGLTLYLTYKRYRREEEAVKNIEPPENQDTANIEPGQPEPASNLNTLG
jgi:hypothetical protein